MSLGSLVFIGLCAWVAYRVTASAIRESRDINRTRRRAAGWIVAVAAYAAMTRGEPTCVETSDPLLGGCEEYSEAYAVTAADRATTFARALATLGIPSIVAFLREKTTDELYPLPTATED